MLMAWFDGFKGLSFLDLDKSTTMTKQIGQIFCGEALVCTAHLNCSSSTCTSVCLNFTWASRAECSACRQLLSLRVILFSWNLWPMKKFKIVKVQQGRVLRLQTTFISPSLNRPFVWQKCKVVQSQQEFHYVCSEVLRVFRIYCLDWMSASCIFSQRGFWVWGDRRGAS